MARKLYGAAAKSAAKARARRSRSSATRSSRPSTVRRTVRYVKVAAVRSSRRRASGAGAGLIGTLVKGATIAVGTWGAGKLADRLPVSSPGLRAAALAGTGALLAAAGKEISALARRVPLARRLVTPGAVQLFGLTLVGAGAARGFAAVGGVQALRRLSPFGGGAAPALPQSGTVALGPGRVRVPISPRTARAAAR